MRTLLLLMAIFILGCEKIELRKQVVGAEKESTPQYVSPYLESYNIHAEPSYGDQNYPTDTTKTANGNIYISAISGDASNGWEWSTIYKSTDDGASFTRVDQYMPYINGESHYLSIDHYNNDLFVCGYEWDSDNYTGVKWIIRKSTDGGSTWSTVDLDEEDSNDKLCQDIRVNQLTGDIYAIGYDSTLDDGAGGTKTGVVIKESNDGGSTWTNIYEYAVAAGTSKGWSIEVLPNGNLLFIKEDAALGARRMYKGVKSGTWTFTAMAQDFGTGTALTGYQISGSILAIDNNTYFYSGRVNNTWDILKTTDAGSTWTAVYTAPSSSYLGRDIEIDGSGNLYAVGTFNDVSNFDQENDDFLIMKSTDLGSTWTTSVMDQIPRALGLHIEIADDGSIHAFGKFRYGMIHSSSSDSGVSWNVEDQIHMKEQYYNYMYDLQADNNGYLYTVGYVAPVDDSNNDPWYIGRSQDGGVTWETVDLFSYGDSHTMTEKLVVASNGNVLAMGVRSYKIGSDSETIVRVSSDSGDTWTNSDIFTNPGAANNANPVDIVADSLGNIFYCASYKGTGSPPAQSALRRNSNDGVGAWATTTTFPITGGALQFYCADLFVDANDTLWMYGKEEDSSNIWEMVLYSSSDFGSSWSEVSRTAIAAGWDKIAVDSSGVIYRSYGNTLEKSVDSGSTWIEIMDSTYQRSDFILTENDEVYVTSYDGKLYSYSAVGPTFWIEERNDIGQVEPLGRGHIYYTDSSDFLSNLGNGELGILGEIYEQGFGAGSFFSIFDTNQ